MLRSSWQCVPFAGQAWVDFQSALKATGGYKWIWDADDEHGEHCTRIVYVKDQMGHSSIQVTVDIYGHLIPGANVFFVDRLDGGFPEEARTSPPQSATPAQPSEMEIPPDLLQVVEGFGGGGRTRTYDLRIMRPSL